MRDLEKKYIRRFILITLSHVERRNLSKEEVSNRIVNTFKCRSVIVAQEKHKVMEKKHPSLGIHFHVAVLNDNASKNNATSLIRKCFPEFEGRQCLVSFHKGWNTICAYVSKEDIEPHVWGEFSLEQIRRIGLLSKKKVKNSNVDNPELMLQLSKCKEWLHVYNQPDIANRLLHKYSNFRKVHEDLLLLQMQQTSFAERIVSYLHNKGWPEEYWPEQIGEKYLLLDWIACQAAFDRPIKTKQLFLYGEPSTQKTLILHFLSKAMRIYFVSSRVNDFSDADNYYDLWVFEEANDECLEQSYSNAYEIYQNTLLKVLDGQECRLDSKYGRIFTKNRNVPILMVANHMPLRVKRNGPMRERFLRLRFQSQIDDLEEERVIATLWGCFFRRIDRMFSFTTHDQDESKGISIQYNSTIALFAPPKLNFLKAFFDEGEEALHDRITLAMTKQLEILYATSLFCKCSNSRAGGKGYSYCELHTLENLDFSPTENMDFSPTCLSLLQFAFIPILKRNDIPPNTFLFSFPEVFKDDRQGTTFQIFRNNALNYDFLVWPAYLSPVNTKEILDPANDPWTWPCNHQVEKKQENGLLMDWPLKLHIWAWASFFEGHLGRSIQQEPPSDIKIRGFWRISLGVPPRKYDGDWDEMD